MSDDLLLAMAERLADFVMEVDVTYKPGAGPNAGSMERKGYRNGEP